MTNHKMLSIATICGAIFICTARAVVLARSDPGSDFNNTDFDWSTYPPSDTNAESFIVPDFNNTLIPVTNETAAYQMDTDGPSYGSALEFAGGAVNLEVVYSVAIHGFRPRFKEGMGPGSAYYENNLQSFEASGSDPNAIYSDSYGSDYSPTSRLRKRDQKFHWHGHHSTKRLIYGEHSPGGMMALVARNCKGRVSCDNTQFSVPSFSFGGETCPDISNRQPGNLVITPAGDGWTARTFSYYMTALGVISHLRAKHHNVETGTQCTYIRGQCTCNDVRKIDTHFGGKYFGINLVTDIHGRPNSIGFVQADVQFVQTGLDACNLVVAALEGIAGAGGPIGNIGGGFFGGYIQQAACQNS